MDVKLCILYLEVVSLPTCDRCDHCDRSQNGRLLWPLYTTVTGHKIPPQYKLHRNLASSNLHSLFGCIGLVLFVTGSGTFKNGVSAVAYVACVFVWAGWPSADCFRVMEGETVTMWGPGLPLVGGSSGVCCCEQKWLCLCACRPVSPDRDVLCAMNNVWLPSLVCRVYHSFSNHPLLSWFVARCCCMRVWHWVHVGTFPSRVRCMCWMRKSIPFPWAIVSFYGVQNLAQVYCWGVAAEEHKYLCCSP